MFFLAHSHMYLSLSLSPRGATLPLASAAGVKSSCLSLRSRVPAGLVYHLLAHLPQALGLARFHEHHDHARSAMDNQEAKDMSLKQSPLRREYSLTDLLGNGL